MDLQCTDQLFDIPAINPHLLNYNMYGLDTTNMSTAAVPEQQAQEAAMGPPIDRPNMSTTTATQMSDDIPWPVIDRANTYRGVADLLRMGPEFDRYIEKLESLYYKLRNAAIMRVEHDDPTMTLSQAEKTRKAQEIVYERLSRPLASHGVRSYSVERFATIFQHRGLLHQALAAVVHAEGRRRGLVDSEIPLDTSKPWTLVKPADRNRYAVAISTTNSAGHLELLRREAINLQRLPTSRGTRKASSSAKSGRSATTRRATWPQHSGLLTSTESMPPSAGANLAQTRDLGQSKSSRSRRTKTLSYRPLLPKQTVSIPQLNF